MPPPKLPFDGDDELDPFNVPGTQPVRPNQQAAQQNKGAPNLTARQLLDLALPDIETGEDKGPSKSSATNDEFDAPTRLLWNQHTSCFGHDLMGYPDKILPAAKANQRFYAYDELDEGEIMTEAQAVDAGREYILRPVSRILRHKFNGGKFRVEYLVTGEIPSPTDSDHNRIQRISGNVDAAWTISENGKDNPYAFCEFKRVGVLKDSFWPTATNKELTQSARKVLKQVLKYAWVTNKRYWMVSTWDRFLFLRIPDALPLEGFSYYWQDNISSRRVQIPAQYSDQQPLPKPLDSGWRTFPIQAVMSRDMAMFKILVYAFVCKSFDDRHKPCAPLHPREEHSGMPDPRRFQ